MARLAAALCPGGGRGDTTSSPSSLSTNTPGLAEDWLAKPEARAKTFTRAPTRWAARALPFLALGLLAGCQYDPHARLYTTEKPQESDVAGCYTLARQTVTRDGLAALQGKPCAITLRSDGSFTATNVPPWEQGSPGTNFFGALLTGSGTWQIISVGSVDNGTRPLKTHWGVSLDSPASQMKPAGLTGGKPPYGLIFTLGDPDAGEAMLLEKSK